MCGVVGVISFDIPREKQTDIVKRMMSMISHRGPDEEGIESFEGATLGHVRLAILDLTSDANQPMRSFSGRSTIVYNGEIYNHNELRKELIQAGFRFKTRSDTEVILNAYEYWGERFLSKLNGMFALVIYDEKDGSVFFARDRVGIKPLYYYSNHNSIYFSSEIKGIVSVLDRQLEIEPDALMEYLAFQNYYSDRTLLKGIKLFPAGSFAKLNKHHFQLVPKNYWRASIVATDQSTIEYQEALRSALEETIQSQMKADVPVDSFMSGGIDSCSLASIATKYAGRIKTFTCGFDLSNVTESERLFDERFRAEQVSSIIGSEHYEVVLKSHDFISKMSQWAWHAEEPRVGSSFPNYCVSLLASKFTKICLSGAGADELFGGYPWRFQSAINARSDADFIDQYFVIWSRLLSQDKYKKLVAPIAGSATFDPFEMFSNQVSQCLERTRESNFSYGDTALLFELETFLQGLLIMEDKASMAHGLEVRLPFLDNRLIDLALTIPFDKKVKIEKENVTASNSYGRNSAVMPSFSNGKLILRNLLKEYVPDEIANGRKQGFSPPVETWFRRDMNHWLSEEVFSTRSPLANYLDMNVAKQVWKEHSEQQVNHRLFIWGIIAIHLFMTEFLKGAV